MRKNAKSFSIESRIVFGLSYTSLILNPRMIIDSGNSHDTDSQDVTTDNSYKAGTTSNDDGDSDAASSLSSTPLIEIKKAKMKMQREEDEKRAAKKAKLQPKTKTGKRAASTKPTENKQKKTEATPKKSAVDGTKTKSKNSCKKLSPTKGNTNDATIPETKKKGSVATSSKSESNDDGSSESSEEEEAACCMCHCGVDCSDRALFFPKDRKSELEEDEDYYFGLDDPYLDEKLYDRNNALVYCDTCNRLYHQKCHFVPLLVVPRGEFHCLVCAIQQQEQKKAASQKQKASQKKKGPTKHHHAPDPPIPEKFLKRKITDQIFQSPPNQSKTLDIKALQHEWEIVSGPSKAKTWNLQFKQLRTFLKSQASNIRMANTTLATMTSTKRNRQHFLHSKGTKSSQELAQTLCKLTGAKFKIREALLSLESLRVKNESIDFSTLYSWCEDYSEHANHVFPFGSKFCQEGRRIVPRTRERKNEETKSNEGAIPTEITVGDNSASTQASKKMNGKAASKASKRGEKKNTKSEEVGSDDDDSGITLDDLQCAVCMIGDATDENDVLLCDGKDCHRAFHMKCVYPHVKIEDIENEDEDWFCPICTHSTELMGEIHDLCVDDENDDDSIESWDDVQDVFPGSQWEYETAQKILKGKRNEDTQRLLAMFLGEDINKKKVQMPIGSDSEDENDYSLFDEDSFKERRENEREEKSDDDSVCSSEATLLDYDDIDYKVGKAELAALSEEEGSESDSDEDDDSENQVRRSRRLVKKEEEEEGNPMEFGADFDESNIIAGKRKRKRVDYRKLNDVIFGDLSDKQQGAIDGGDDFDAPIAKPKRADSDNESGIDDSGSESDNDSEGEGSDNGSDSGSDEGSDDGSDDGSGDGSSSESDEGSDDESDN